MKQNRREIFWCPFQTEGEKTELGGRRREAEMERAAARVETARAQQDMMNMLTEKQALESSYGHSQDLCRRLEAELSLLHEENEQHFQVRDPGQSHTTSASIPSTPTTWENYVDFIYSFQQVHVVTLNVSEVLDTSAMLSFSNGI